MKNPFTLIVLFLSLVACNQQATDSEPPAEEDFQTEFITTLKNDPVLPGEPSSVCFVDENHLVVASAKASQVILFDASGNQIRTIGNSGQGPFEYVSPSIVRAYENKVFVWCKHLLKLIEYDLEGKALSENSFTAAIKDFAVYQNYACLYLGGSVSEPSLVQIYDLDKKEYLEEGYGQKDNEHHILSAMACSGRMDLMGSNLLFAPTNQLHIYQLDFDDFTLSSNVLEDENFKVEKVHEPHYEFVINMQKALPYIYGNDVVTGVYVTEDNIIIMAEVGEIVFEGMKIVDRSNRKWKHYVLDHDFTLGKILISDIVPGSSFCMFTAVADNLYFLKMTEDMEGYELHQVKIDD